MNDPFSGLSQKVPSGYSVSKKKKETKGQATFSWKGFKRCCTIIKKAVSLFDSGEGREMTSVPRWDFMGADDTWTRLVWKVIRQFIKTKQPKKMTCDSSLTNAFYSSTHPHPTCNKISTSLGF